MFSSIKKLFGARAGSAVDSSSQSRFPASASVPPPNPQRTVRLDPQGRAATPPANTPNSLAVPLRCVLDRLPPELAMRIRQNEVGDVHISIPMPRVLSQIGSGAVKIPFAELRQSAPPGVFSAETDRDRTMVEIPLHEVLARLNPALLSRRPSQKQVNVPAEVTGPFSGQAQVMFTTAPLKANAPAQPISRVPVPATQPAAPEPQPAPVAEVAPVAPPVPTFVAPQTPRPAAPIQKFPQAATALRSQTPANFPYPQSAPAAKPVAPAQPIVSRAQPVVPMPARPPVAMPPPLPSAALPPKQPAVPPVARVRTTLPQHDTEPVFFKKGSPMPPPVAPQVAPAPVQPVYSPIAPEPAAEQVEFVEAAAPIVEANEIPELVIPEALTQVEPIAPIAPISPFAPVTPLAFTPPPIVPITPIAPEADPGPALIRFTMPPSTPISAPAPAPAPIAEVVPAPIPVAPPAPVAAPVPVQPAETRFLHVALADVSATWPEPVLQEIANNQLGGSIIALPFGMIDVAIRQGKVAPTWQVLRTWIQPPVAMSGSSFDGMILDLPLKVLTPLFLAELRTSKPQKRVLVDDAIPNLFSNASAAPVNAPAKLPSNIPAVVVAAAPMSAPRPVTPLTPKPADTNYFARKGNENAPEEVPPPIKKGPSPGTAFLVRYATPNEIVSKAAALDGVDGAIIALPDGLLVASHIPPTVNADTVAAFLPQIFGRVSQCTKELRLGDLNNLNFTVGNIPWKIFKVGAIFFAAFGRAGEPLPSAQLAGIAAELDRKAK